MLLFMFMWWRGRVGENTTSSTLWLNDERHNTKEKLRGGEEQARFYGSVSAMRRVVRVM
jgi:hypothetical protein